MRDWFVPVEHMDERDEVQAILERATVLAENEQYDDAIRELRKCLEIYNARKDFLAASEIHLIILDYEKMKSSRGTGPTPVAATTAGAATPVTGKEKQSSMEADPQANRQETGTATGVATTAESPGHTVARGVMKPPGSSVRALPGNRPPIAPPQGSVRTGTEPASNATRPSAAFHGDRAAPVNGRGGGPGASLDAAMATWREGKELMDAGENFKAIHKFMATRRMLRVLGAEQELLDKIAIDIQAAKEQDGSIKKPDFSSTAAREIGNRSSIPVQSPDIPARGIPSNAIPRGEKGGRVTVKPVMKPVASGGSSFEELMQRARKFKEKGEYGRAVECYEQVAHSAPRDKKHVVERELQRARRLRDFKEKLGTPRDTWANAGRQAGAAGGDLSGNGVGVGSGHQPQGAFTRVNAGDQVGTMDTSFVSSRTFDENAIASITDHDEREKLRKREQAERLIVEAENSNDPHEAIRKFEDAAHLLLVTGTRHDRVEWIYDRIKQIQLSMHEEKQTLFEEEKFPPAMLREYAFKQIDRARECMDYGRYSRAIEHYKRAIKSLKRAGWADEQVAYLVQDMVTAQVKQDDVERDERAFFKVYKDIVHRMLDDLDGWRAALSRGSKFRSSPATSSIDEDLHRPGRERTVLEKQVARLREEKEARRAKKEMLFDKLDEARFAIDLGKFGEALALYMDVLGIMDDLGGWENQRAIITREIEKLKALMKRKKDIEEMMEAQESTGGLEREDLEERSFLIKKAALLNQEDLKEKLLMKRINDEKAHSALDILVPAATRLAARGDYEDAVVEYKEALKLLNEAGWSAHLGAIQDEISRLEGIIANKQADRERSEVGLVPAQAMGGPDEESLRLQEKVLDELVPRARRAKYLGQWKVAAELYTEALTILRDLGFSEFISPLVDELAEVEEQMERSLASPGTRVPAGSTREEQVVTTEHAGASVPGLMPDKDVPSLKDEKRSRANESIDLGMRFLAKDLKEYAVQEFEKALDLLEEIGDNETAEEIERQIKKIKLELRLDESRDLLLRKL